MATTTLETEPDVPPVPDNPVYQPVSGDPGPGADLPVSTGRDPESGTPDTITEPAPAGAVQRRITKRAAKVTPGTAAAVIAAMVAQVGYHEGKDKGGDWDNVEKFAAQVGLAWVSTEHQPWCEVFGSYGFQAGGMPKGSYPVTASCPVAVAFWKAKKRWSEYPAVGAAVFYGPGGGSHTGTVYAYDADYIYTVEGNTNDNGSSEGDGVYLKKRARRDTYVYGYGYPEYPGGIVSADPQWAKPTPAKPTPAPVAHLQPFPGASFFHAGRHSAIVTAMGRRLVTEGCSAYTRGPSPDWTNADRDSYAKWQRKYSDAHGLKWSAADCNGIPGQASWDALKVPKQ